jgi:hypothetical protein
LKAKEHKRNGNLFDRWSIVHLCAGVVFGWLMNPLLAVVLMALWEPIEIFIISPLVARAGIVFGYESFRNSLSDIFFDTAGILCGAVVLRLFISPPFLLF